MKKPRTIIESDPAFVATANANVARTRGNARLLAKEAAAKLDCGYPPGYFSALVREHDWPPEFKAHPSVSDWRSPSAMSKKASEAREAAAERGEAWGLGKICLPGTPNQLRPGWEKR